MMRTLTFAAVATFGALAFTTASPAAEQKATFESLDKNADGKVSLNEASTDDELFVAFKNLDGDRDGELTKEEFARYKGTKK